MRHISRILQRIYDIYSKDLIQYEISKYNITSDNQFNHKFYEMNQKIFLTIGREHEYEKISIALSFKHYH